MTPQKLKLWPNSKTQIVTQLWQLDSSDSNDNRDSTNSCDSSDSSDIFPLELWQN